MTRFPIFNSTSVERCSFALKLALLLISLLSLSACVSSTAPGSQKVPGSIAILGVTTAPGVDSGKSQSSMALELQDLIHERGRHRTLRTDEVRKVLNSVSADSHQIMLNQYARTGTIDPQGAQLLVAARMPVQMALIARVVENRKKEVDPEPVPLRNTSGELMTDRTKIILSSQRVMLMQATMINLSTGAIFWTRTYRSEPKSRASYVKYEGSSFSGSLAAHLANTMTNGIKAPQPPPAPSNQMTLRSLFREIVRNIP